MPAETMPDPKTLQIGDRIRYVHRPDEWSEPGYTVHEESVAFMDALIARGRSVRIAEIDEHGTPWFEARLRDPDGELEYHSWGVLERTGWRHVRART